MKNQAGLAVMGDASSTWSNTLFHWINYYQI